MHTRKDRLAYSDEAISSLIIKGEKGEICYKRKIEDYGAGGGKRSGKEGRERKKNYDETQSRLKRWAAYFLGAQIT